MRLASVMSAIAGSHMGERPITIAHTAVTRISLERIRVINNVWEFTNEIIHGNGPVCEAHVFSGDIRDMHHGAQYPHLSKRLFHKREMHDGPLERSVAHEISKHCIRIVFRVSNKSGGCGLSEEMAYDLMVSCEEHGRLHAFSKIARVLIVAEPGGKNKGFIACRVILPNNNRFRWNHVATVSVWLTGSCFELVLLGLG